MLHIKTVTQNHKGVCWPKVKTVSVVLDSDAVHSNPLPM